MRFNLHHILSEFEYDPHKNSLQFNSSKLEKSR